MSAAAAAINSFDPNVALAFRRCLEAPRFRPSPPDLGPGELRLYWCERYRGVPRTFTAPGDTRPTMGYTSTS